MDGTVGNSAVNQISFFFAAQPRIFSVFFNVYKQRLRLMRTSRRPLFRFNSIHSRVVDLTFAPKKFLLFTKWLGVGRDKEASQPALALLLSSLSMKYTLQKYSNSVKKSINHFVKQSHFKRQPGFLSHLLHLQ